MKLVHPCVSAIRDHRRLQRWSCAAALLTSLGCSQRGLCADRESTISGIVSENVASAQQRQLDKLTITPEVSSVRTRLTPEGPSQFTPDGRPLSELAGVDYKLWMSHGRADVGVGMGTLGYVVPRPDGRVEGPVALTGASPTLSVGVRYRVTSRSAVYADASGAHGLGVDQPANYVNTKVGMEWKPAKNTFGFEHGAIGMHFDSGYHLSVKARRGGLGLYLRGQF